VTPNLEFEVSYSSVSYNSKMIQDLCGILYLCGILIERVTLRVSRSTGITGLIVTPAISAIAELLVIIFLLQSVNEKSLYKILQ